MPATAPERDPVKVARARRDLNVITAVEAGFSLRAVGRAFGIAPSHVLKIYRRLRPKALSK
jgi:hypothetical protein